MIKSERHLIAQLQRSFFKFIDELTDGQALLTDDGKLVIGKHVTNRRQEPKNPYAVVTMLDGRLHLPESATSSWLDLTLAQLTDVNRKDRRNRKAGRTGILKVTIRCQMLETVKRKIQRAAKQYAKLHSSIICYYETRHALLQAS